MNFWSNIFSKHKTNQKSFTQKKFDLVYPLQRAHISNFILKTKGKDLTWKKFNFWGQILSPPHWGQSVPVLGL